MARCVGCGDRLFWLFGRWVDSCESPKCWHSQEAHVPSSDETGPAPDPLTVRSRSDKWEV